MDRIADTFAQCRAEKRPAFIAYMCAGDPDETTSLEICRELLRNGVDILELGVPFSDPLADGRTNQLAAQRALESGMTQERSLDMVRTLRQEFSQPIVFYTYYNLIHSAGIESYVEQSHEAGLDGILTLDCPPEEAAPLVDGTRSGGLKNIFIVAPSTPEERIPTIVNHASGFLYYVSRLGVTGARETLSEGIQEAVERIRKHTDLPVAVGFGISRPEHIQELAAYVDGVVVGSALVTIIENNRNTPGKLPELVAHKVRELLQQ
mgnify:CR=1 FL=1